MQYAKIAPIMSRLWGPLAAVSTVWEGKANAQIALAIGGASIVPEQSRVVVQLYKHNYTNELARRSRVFCLNFLRKDQLQLMHHLGFTSGRDRDKLAAAPYRVGVTGSPVLLDCYGYLDCRVVNAMDGGDMTCFLAEVVDGDTFRPEAEQLWWDYVKKVMPAEWWEQWRKKMDVDVAWSRAHMSGIQGSPW